MLTTHSLILQKLETVATEQAISIIYATESGSRAWGFESPDSDWDVRFFYLRPTDYYLLNFESAKRDCIDAVEYPVQSDNIDLSGWDLHKTCRLLLKSNPAALEWLNSPLVYVNQCQLQQQLKALIPLVYNRRSAMYHYQHMAQVNWRKYISKKNPLLLKKYLYVLRPIFAMQWIEAYESPVPMLFDELVSAVNLPTAVKTELDDLLALKRASSEKEYGAPLPAIHSYIADHIDSPSRIVATRTPQATEAAKAAIRQVFFETLRLINGRYLPLPN
jgi:predicted nucleotidyltransferase